MSNSDFPAPFSVSVFIAMSRHILPPTSKPGIRMNILNRIAALSAYSILFSYNLVPLILITPQFRRTRCPRLPLFPPPSLPRDRVAGVPLPGGDCTLNFLWNFDTVFLIYCLVLLFSHPNVTYSFSLRLSLLTSPCVEPLFSALSEKISKVTQEAGSPLFELRVLRFPFLLPPPFLDIVCLPCRALALFANLAPLPLFFPKNPHRQIIDPNCSKLVPPPFFPPPRWVGSLRMFRGALFKS